MRFSLVTCTRGRSHELSELFESLVRQKRNDFEVILIDQNIDDRLIDIVAQYTDHFPLRHIRVQGTGVSRARNEGLKYASGELIGFPDDDCRYLDGYLDAVDTIFTQDASLGCITGNTTAKAELKLDDACLSASMELDHVSVLNRCQEFTVFVRNQDLGNIQYNVNLGVGAGTQWGAEEGPDLLIRLVHTGARLVFFSQLFVYHPNKIQIVNRATLQRAAGYARGRGCLLRLHSFPFSTIVSSVLRPSAGFIVSLLKCDPRRAVYYFTIVVGTLRGLFITKSELGMVREGCYTSAPGPLPMALEPVSSRPLITVLIANYNYAHFLPSALDSLTTQTYTNWHAVICDDGSTDNSIEVIQQYSDRDSRFELIAKSNGGQNSAFNAAYVGVRGAIVCLLDADDTFEPTKLEKVVKEFHQHPDAGLCNHFSRVIDESGRQKAVTMHRVLDSGWQGETAVKRGACVYVPTTSCMCIRREIADALFPVPAAQDRDLDGYVAMAAQFLAPICVIDEQLSCYRIHGNNMGGLTEPTAERLRYELHLIQLRTANVKGFAKARFGESFAAQIRMEENPQYIQAALKLLALERRGSQLSRPSDLIRRHPNAKWRAVWRLIFAAPAPLTRYAIPFIHRSHQMKAILHRLIGVGATSADVEVLRSAEAFGTSAR